MSPGGVDRLLNADEVAERLAVSVRWVRETTRSGAIPHVQLGRSVRYDWADVVEWLDTCKHAGHGVAFRRAAPVRQTGTKHAKATR